MNVIEEFEQEQVKKLLGDKTIPQFAPGDTIKVWVKITEGTTEREQAFEGVCIARRNRALNSSFTVRKISYGEGVERVFPLYSPKIRIEVVRQGSVRRAKLYYLRDLTGKKARISAKKRGLGPNAGHIKKGKKELRESTPLDPTEHQKASNHAGEGTPATDSK